VEFIPSADGVRVKYLVVNADDFGACSGVNGGIIEAHRRGIVTSASLMVGMPGTEEAARLAGRCPLLSVGLHAVLPEEVVQVADRAYVCRTALEDQMSAFAALVGRLPTHLDSHHHVHQRPGLLPHFQAVADGFGIPLRAFSGVRYSSRFYGRWNGATHPEQVSAESLVAIIEADVTDGVTELACHPGLPDPTLVSSYTLERTLELSTLCAPEVLHFIEDSEMKLVGFAEVPHLLGAPT
jgi:chitin disaccharide deacetylase